MGSAHRQCVMKPVQSHNTIGRARYRSQYVILSEAALVLRSRRIFNKLCQVKA